MKIVWALAAEQDRSDILDYIADDNVTAAARLDELFSAAADSLRDNSVTTTADSTSRTNCGPDATTSRSPRLRCTCRRLDDGASPVWSGRWPPVLGGCLLITTSVFANMKSIPVRIGSREAFRLEGWRKAYVLLPMTVVGLAVTVFPLEVACGIRLRGYVCP